MADKSNPSEGYISKTDEAGLQQCDIGSVFRKAREDNGIKIEEVSSVTRIRPAFIEAIENEKWDILPSPGFIPGFLKTYANYLGIDETEVLFRYHTVRLADKKKLTPLDKNGKNHKRSLFIWVFGTLFVAVMGTFIVLDPLPWKERSEVFFKLIKSEITETQIFQDSVSDVSVMSGREDESKKSEREDTLVVADDNNLTDSSEQSILFKNENAEKNIDDVSAVSFQHAKNNVQKELMQSSEHPKSDEAVETVFSMSRIPEKGYLLEVVVLKDVFLRVKRDDLPSKDYMLKVGTFSWTAEEKFDLRIGNASSLTLILNGEEVKNIGAPGTVVNLSLPKK